MPRAICVSSGAPKSAPYRGCPECGFDPTDEMTLVKSVYLSIGRFDTDDAEEISDYSEELGRMAEIIRRGEEIDYERIPVYEVLPAE